MERGDFMSKYLGYDEKSKARTMRYNATSRENLVLNLPKGTKDRYRQYATAHGYKSLTAYIVALIEQENKVESGT